MLFFKFVTLICVSSVLSVQIKDENKELEVMAQAISDVLAKFSITKANRVDICTQFYQTNHLEDLRDSIIEKVNHRFTYEVKFDNNDRIGKYLQKPSLILIENSYLLKTFFMKFKILSSSPWQHKILIYCQNASLGNFINIKKYMNVKMLDFHDGSIEQFVYFIFEHESVIFLATISWFNKNSCNNPHLEIVDNFDKNLLKWSNIENIPNKFMNFHGCDLIFPQPMNEDPDPNDPNQTIIVKSNVNNYEIYIFSLLSEKYNYNPEFQEIEAEDIVALFYFPKNYLFIDRNYPFPTAFFKYVHQHHVIGSSKDKSKRNLHKTVSFQQLNLIFLVTPGELYTAYEKLYLPFDEPTWVLLFITFSAAFAVIFLVNFTSKPFQVLVYGHGVKIPSLNVVGTFFGIGQTKLPDLSFSRFILMMFILFCLIIRTAYQGVLFELMTSQRRKPEPKNIRGLIDQNYTLLIFDEYAYYEINQRSQNEESQWPNFKRVSVEIFEIYKTQFDNGTAKLSLLVPHHMIPGLNLLSGDYIPWRLLNEIYGTFQFSFAFFPNNFLYQPLNDAMENLNSAGILQYLYRKLFFDSRYSPRYTKKFIEESEPQVFALSDLDFGFYVWLGTCAVAIFVFLIELLGWLPKKYGKKEISKEEIRNEVKNFIEDLGEVYENDAVEVANSPRYTKKFIEESEPQVFALSDLDFGFYVWLGTCAVAIFVFLIELLGWLPKKYGKKEISKGEIQNKVKNFIEDLGEVYENDAVESLSKELSAPFSSDKSVTEITTEDINEIEEIKIESRRMSENSDDEIFAKIHPNNDSVTINENSCIFEAFKINSTN
ncbi:hypothetical protein PVAND_009343 [Polypedilum vanderplanki]|uniref:Ionotropic receptor n=1 Tax=Polypedilum vanderplanki TaxID=319348 RepID=A0A9J6CD05_POLVA|nr:hypothetical protein PVAND_009343 [Polypedilum vanderplanki]